MRQDGRLPEPAPAPGGAGNGRRAGQVPCGTAIPAIGQAGYSTILEIGISRMSCAPAALRAGISVLTPRFGTTVSTAFIPLLASAVTVGEDIAGSMAATAWSLAAGTFSLSSTWPRALIAPWSSSAT